MVNVINIGFLANQPSYTPIDLSGYLEDKIAQLVMVERITVAGAVTTDNRDYNGRVSVATSSCVAANMRLSDWQEISPGSHMNSEDALRLTVLYLKDAPGIYP